MASLKTSQETSGYPLQKNDLHRIARGGNNHKVNSEELFSEVLTYTQFETKRTAGNLIAGRWYKVSECGYDLNQTILVLADTNISWNPRIKWLTAPSVDTVECDAIELNQDFVRYYDSQGNNYGGYANFCADYPPIGKGSTWYNTKIDNISNCCFTNPSNGQLNNTYLNNVTLVFANMTIENSNIYALNDASTPSQVPFVINNCEINNLYYENNKKSGQISIQNSKLDNVEIYFSGGGNVSLTNLDLKDCVLFITDDVTISNSSFNNVTVELFGGQVSVTHLQIFGKGAANTQYKINGAFQNRILNSWAGMVVADTRNEINTERCGFSTVKMKLLITDDFSANEGIFDYPSGEVYLAEQSIVGIYLFDTIPPAAYNVNGINENSGHCQHEIKFAFYDNSNQGELNFQFQTFNSNVGSPNQIVQYHGKTNKVGKLLSMNDSITLKNQYNVAAGFTCWWLVYGVHYD